MSDCVQTAIMFSGRGSNMRALIEAAQRPDYPATIACCITDTPDAPGIAHATEAGLPVEVVDPGQHRGKEGFETALQEVLTQHGIELICLAGFMRILSADFPARWPGRIINIHPSLLPAYKGLNTHARVLANGDSVTGCSVHYVDSGIDTGDLIAQIGVPVRPYDTIDTLEQRVREAEHTLYPAALAHVAHNLLHSGPGKA